MNPVTLTKSEKQALVAFVTMTRALLGPIPSAHQRGRNHHSQRRLEVFGEHHRRINPEPKSWGGVASRMILDRNGALKPFRSSCRFFVMARPRPAHPCRSCFAAPRRHARHKAGHDELNGERDHFTWRRWSCS